MGKVEFHQFAAPVLREVADKLKHAGAMLDVQPGKAAQRAVGVDHGIDPDQVARLQSLHRTVRQAGGKRQKAAAKAENLKQKAKRRAICFIAVALLANRNLAQRTVMIQGHVIADPGPVAGGDGSGPWQRSRPGIATPGPIRAKRLPGQPGTKGRQCKPLVGSVDQPVDLTSQGACICPLFAQGKRLGIRCAIRKTGPVGLHLSQPPLVKDLRQPARHAPYPY